MEKIVERAKEKFMRKATSLAKQSLQESGPYGWPPHCMGLFYEPKCPDELCKKDIDKNGKKM